MEEAAMVVPTISSLTIHGFAKETEPVTMTIPFLRCGTQTNRPSLRLCQSLPPGITSTLNCSTRSQKTGLLPSTLYRVVVYHIAKLNTAGVDESKLQRNAVPRCSGYFTARDTDGYQGRTTPRTVYSLPDEIYGCFDPVAS